MKILLISKDEILSKFLKGHLTRFGPVAASHDGDGAAMYSAESPDAVIIDIGEDSSGMDLLESIRGAHSDSNIIAITSRHEMETTVEVIKKGAFDCITKPLNVEELDLALRKVEQNIDLHRRLNDLQAEISREYRVGSIVGKSKSMEEIFKTIGIASQTKVTILIQGESGTGKELIARAIHYNSAEKDRPFVGINCSALVETLLESELFGHEKGAFTGALFRKEGKFEAARGGTVFLDEIGEMSHALQVKLLRVLQERSFERVGGSGVIKTDVRVITATNKDLKELTSSGAFREDLFYRLKVITIEVPPLRERKEDIPLLVMHLLEKANRELHKKVKKVPDGIMERLIGHSWPGNVRELENVITRGVLLAKGDVLMDIFLPGAEPLKDKDGWKPLGLDEIERAHIEKTLSHCRWNKSRAAALLGVTLPRLERKIRKYGLRKNGAP